MNKFWLILALLIIAVGGILLINKVFAKPKTTANHQKLPVNQAATSHNQTNTNSSDSAVKKTTEQIGSGPAAKAGDSLHVTYTGKLENGTVFDSNVGKSPFTLTLGQHQVIEGWEQGLLGTQAGGHYSLTIPPSLGYGNQAMGSIPPNSTLIFDITVNKIN